MAIAGLDPVEVRVEMRAVQIAGGRVDLIEEVGAEDGLVENNPLGR